MRFIILLTTFLGGALTMGDPFLQFAKEHGKNYSTRAELDHRRAIFEKNFLDMVEHNAKFEIGEVSWHRKVTPDYDLTKEEFASLRLRQTHPHTSIKSKDRIPQVFQDKLNEVKSLPSSWNWVDEGGVSSVKNQGDCGSCSAFAATALVESCFWQASGHLYDDLSEQFLVDCAYGHELTDNGYTDGAWGCDGAWTPVYWDWMIKNSEGKHQRESNYGYEAANHNCRAHSDGYYPRATVSDYAITYSPNQHTIQKWVHISPVGTSIDASHLGDYDHGVFDDSRCCESSSDPDCWWENNHDVTVVGYGTENGHDYWLVKNSWGSHFGEDGYFKIKRGKGICGFAGYGIEAATCNAA